jgi:ADP-heptose:LPS heptosyltransferase
VAHDPAIREVLLYDKRSLVRTWRTIRQLRRRRYDVTIDLLANVSATSLFILLLAGKDGFKIGVRKNNSVGLYDFIIPERQLRTTPAVALHFAALLPFGLDGDSFSGDPGIQLAEEQWRRGRELIDSLRQPGRDGLVGVNISAGKPNRLWGVDRYCGLIEKLSQRHGELQFLIFAAPAEHLAACRIAEAGGPNVTAIPPQLSLRDVIAMIKHLDLIMTPDTSICHVASSLRIPLLGLYTAAEENFQRWRPWHQPAWVLRPPSGDSLQGITVADYLAKAEEAFQIVFKRAVAG